MTHMAHALVQGKRFRVGTGGVIYYDKRFTNHFRFENTDIGVLLELFDQDIWTEVTPVHTHQVLIDSYQEGQAWQFTLPYMQGVYADCEGCGVWIEPAWDERGTYRLHPHNTLIQEHRRGATVQAYICGDWIEEPSPDWYEDTKYRVKPATSTVYEWMCKPKLGHTWELEELLLTEEEAKEYYLNGHDYQKTGRSWEVEV